MLILQRLTQSRMDRGQQVPGVKWLVKETRGALAESALPGLVIVVTRNEDDRQVRALELNPPVEFEPVHSRHANVRNQTDHRLKVARLHKFLRGREDQNVVAGGFHETLYGLSNP